MNKKLMWGVVIVVVVGALYVYRNKDSFMTTPPAYNYQDWKTYKDKKYGVEINYPTKVNWGVGYVDNEEWFTSDNSKNVSYSNNLSVGFGTPYSRPGGLIWDLGVMDKADFDLERYIKVTGEQFFDRQEKRDKIYVKSTPALLVTVTSESNKDWISKSVIVEKGGKVYVMGNGSTNQLKDFQQFYKSLKFTPLTPDSSSTNEQKLISVGKEVLTALKNKDYTQLETLTSKSGLSFNEYPYELDLAKSDVTKDGVSDIPTDTTVRMWGYTDGKGDEIRLTTSAYISKWIYSADFLNAPTVVVNKKAHQDGNTPNNIDQFAKGRNYVGFNFPGTEQYAGMNYSTLYLIFDIENGEYKVRGMIKDVWTI